MYSPKIKEDHIPVLYRLAKSKKQRMTAIVNEAITQYLEREASIDSNDVASRKTWQR